MYIADAEGKLVQNYPTENSDNGSPDKSKLTNYKTRIKPGLRSGETTMMKQISKDRPVRNSIETDANPTLKRKGTQNELQKPGAGKNGLQMSTSSKNPLSNAHSIKSTNINPQIKKLMPASVFESEASEIGGYSAKVIEVTPKTSQLKHSSPPAVKKEYVLEPNFENRSDPIEQLRALAVMKEQQSTEQMALVKYVESDNENAEDIWREKDANFYFISPRQATNSSRKVESHSGNYKPAMMPANAREHPREWQTEEKGTGSIEQIKSKPFKAVQARSVIKDYQEVPIVTPPDEQESQSVFERVQSKFLDKYKNRGKKNSGSRVSYYHMQQKLPRQFGEDTPMISPSYKYLATP